MQIDVPAHIEKLLFLHDTLTIPGFGTFTATKVSSTADYAGGMVNPPSKSLTFSENITTDDGVLIHDIASTNGIAHAEARRSVEEFVEKIQAQLTQREIVTLPSVGRLYKNYVQKIQFLPDTTNFSPESFGLPPLQFSPIGRSREVEKTADAAPPVAAQGSTIRTATTPPPPPATTIKTAPAPLSTEPYTPQATRNGGAGWATALGIFLLFCALSGGYWLWQRQKEKLAIVDDPEKTERTTLPSPAKTNESPKKSEKAPVTPEKDEASLVRDPAEEKKVQESVAERTQAAREQIEKPATAPKGARECILVVATLREKANADRLEQMLKEEGFEVYYLQKNGYQVGIRFHYSRISEVQDKIVTLKNLTGEKDIWIKKK